MNSHQEYPFSDTDDDAEYKEVHELAERIREKKKLMKNEQKDNNTKKPIIPRTAEPKARERSVKRLKREFEELGVDMQTDGGTNFEVSVVPHKPNAKNSSSFNHVKK